MKKKAEVKVAELEAIAEIKNKIKVLEKSGKNKEELAGLKALIGE